MDLARQNSDFFPQLSIIIPLLNEEASLQELSCQIIEALGRQFSFEIIFVDDGSEDQSWQEIKMIIQSQPQYQIKGIQLLRNYGKSTALQAGFDEAQGRYIATLDADLQDDPQEIPAMVAMLDKGYDMISGWKKQRNDPLQKTIPSRFFNAVTATLTGIKLHDFNCGLKVYKRAVIEHIQLYGERHRYIPLLAKWEGYDRIGEKKINHRPRKYGATKFGFPRFMHGFLDLLTLKFVGRYHQRPMHFFGTLGFIFLISGTGINLYLAAIKVLNGADLSNRPLLLLGLLLMVLGAQFFSIGFLGELFYKDRHEHDKPNVRDKI